MADKPRIGITMGDAAGIGPEIIAKALATGDVYQVARPVVIGSAWALEQGIKLINSNLKVRKVDSVEGTGEDPSVVDVLGDDLLNPDDIIPAKATAACGKAQVGWGQLADSLAKEGKLQAVAGSPGNTEAAKLAGINLGNSAVTPGSSFLFLISGPLRVVHMVDHITMKETMDWIKKDNVLQALDVMQTSLAAWGMPCVPQAAGLAWRWPPDVAS